MKTLTKPLFVICLLVAIASPEAAIATFSKNPTPINPPNFKIIISEIMFNPASTEDAWEWIEIYNAGTQTVDLTGFVIDDINGTAHASANINAGMVAPGKLAVLYNADDITAEDFGAAWGEGINLIAVNNWAAMGLNNSTDTIGLWENYEDYSQDHETHANVLVSASYPDIDDNSGSVFLENLEDQSSFELSISGSSDPLGGTAYRSLDAAGNSGADIGSPGNQETMSPSTPEVTGFVLVDATSELDILPIIDGSTIDINSLGTDKFSVRVNTTEVTESTYIALSGPRNYSRTENVTPYSLFGDNAGQYFGRSLPPGSYTITATPYSEDHLNGAQGKALSIRFEFTTDIRVTSFTLVDADLNKDIVLITEGMKIDNSALPTQNLNIRASTTKQAESVRLQLSGAQNKTRTENVEPYALFGDRSGNYFSGSLAPGVYNLMATSYPKNNGKGSPGNSMKVNFEILDSPQFRSPVAKIYPNPARIEATVSFNLPVELQKIQLFDLYGQKVKIYDPKNIKIGNEYLLELNDLQSGIYFLKMWDDKGVQFQQEIIVK